MITVHLKKLRQRIEISSDEERVIRDSIAEVRRVGADQIVIRAGEELSSSLMLLDGWMARSKDLAGGERQVTQLHVAGDFADLHGFTLKQLDDDITTLSDCRIATVPHERFGRSRREYPRLGRIFWFSTNMDAAIQRELVLSLGQRSAISRMAHLFCELYVRLDVVGKDERRRLRIPADAA